MDEFAKSAIPSQFQDDFNDYSSESEEENVQCYRKRQERKRQFHNPPYARERNKEECNANLPLPRTESHNPHNKRMRTFFNK
jgi:hypothetical protein